MAHVYEVDKKESWSLIITSTDLEKNLTAHINSSN
jgi:hypothetical protein